MPSFRGGLFKSVKPSLRSNYITFSIFYTYLPTYMDSVDFVEKIRGHKSPRLLYLQFEQFPELFCFIPKRLKIYIRHLSYFIHVVYLFGKFCCFCFRKDKLSVIESININVKIGCKQFFTRFNLLSHSLKRF